MVQAQTLVMRLFTATYQRHLHKQIYRIDLELRPGIDVLAATALPNRHSRETLAIVGCCYEQHMFSCL